MNAALRALQVLAVAAIACAQPCTPCAGCRSPQCWRECSAVCPTITPDKLVVKRGTQCVKAGAMRGPDAAKEACEYAMGTCDPRRLGAGYSSDAIGKISLPQCSKVAQGACAQAAGDTAPEACQAAAQQGYKSCGAAQFVKLFHERSGAVCTQWAKTVTEVDPLTGQWAQQGGGGRRRLQL